MADFWTILADSLHAGTLRSAVLSKKRKECHESLEKLTVRPLVLQGQSCYQFTSRTAGRETHNNLPAAAAVARLRELFGPTFEHCHLFTADADYAARFTRTGTVKVTKNSPSGKPVATVHNRAKNYLIPDGVPCRFLQEIGVMTRNGKVRAARYDKFRQINRFLELVDDVVDCLPAEDRLNVVDFGCGKSYLTFAIYHLLAEIRGRDVHIVGLDRNGDVVRDCSRIAERLDHAGLEFQVGEIAGYRDDRRVDLAVSLHACDTATDDALAKAVGWRAGVIFAAPCCQHELSTKLHNKALSSLQQHGVLRERFAALATDALRAKALEICGYKAQVIEFVDLEHTSKNLLIRAIRRSRGLPHGCQGVESYRKFKELLHLEQIYLEEAFGADFIQHVRK